MLPSSRPTQHKTPRRAVSTAPEETPRTNNCKFQQKRVNEQHQHQANFFLPQPKTDEGAALQPSTHRVINCEEKKDTSSAFPTKEVNREVFKPPTEDRGALPGPRLLLHTEKNNTTKMDASFGDATAPKLVGAAEAMSTHFSSALTKVQKLMATTKKATTSARGGRRVYDSATSESLKSSIGSGGEEEEDDADDLHASSSRLSSQFSASMATDSEEMSPMMRMRQKALGMPSKNNAKKEGGQDGTMSNNNNNNKTKKTDKRKQTTKNYKTEEQVKAEKQRSWRRKMKMAQQQRHQESQSLLEFNEQGSIKEDILEDASTISGGGSSVMIGCYPGSPFAEIWNSISGKELGHSKNNNNKTSKKNPSAFLHHIINARCGEELDRVSSSDIDLDDDESSSSSISSDAVRKMAKRRGRSRRRRSPSPRSQSESETSAVSDSIVDAPPTEVETSRAESSIREASKDELTGEKPSTVEETPKPSNLKSSSFNINDVESATSASSVSAYSVTPKGPSIATNTTPKTAFGNKQVNGLSAVKSVSFDESTISKPSVSPVQRSASITNINKADPNFIRNFVDTLATHGISLLWHRPPTVTKSTSFTSKPSASRPQSVTAYLRLTGAPSARNSPRLVWYSNSKDDSENGFAKELDLFDIASMETTTRGSPAVRQVLESFPYSMPSRSFVLNLNPSSQGSGGGKTAAGSPAPSSMYVLEATSDDAAQTFVYGMKWMVARLSYNLIIGNVSVSCELLPYELADAGSKDDDSMTPRRPPGMQRTNAMNDITCYMVDKTLEKSNLFTQQQQQQQQAK